MVPSKEMVWNTCS